jgi:hypothetical protein
VERPEDSVRAAYVPAHGQVQSILFASRDPSAGNVVLVSSVRSIARLDRLRIESANRVQEIGHSSAHHGGEEE